MQVHTFTQLLYTFQIKLNFTILTFKIKSKSVMQQRAVAQHCFSRINLLNTTILK